MQHNCVRRLSIALAASLMVATLAPAARAQVTLGLGGGPTFPTGSLSNAYGTGFNGMINLGLGVPAFPLGFRANGLFDQLPVKSATGFSGHTQIYSVSANAILTTTGIPIVAPYLIGGVGYYNNHYSVNLSGTTVVAGGSTTANNLGINGGGGFRFGVATLSLFAEVRYHYVFNGSSHYQFVPITVGVMF